MGLVYVICIGLISLSHFFLCECIVSDMKWEYCSTSEPFFFDVRDVIVNDELTRITGTPTTDVAGGDISINIEREVFFGVSSTPLYDRTTDLCDAVDCPLLAGKEINIDKTRGIQSPMPGKYSATIELFGDTEGTPDRIKLACIKVEFKITTMAYLTRLLSVASTRSLRFIDPNETAKAGGGSNLGTTNDAAAASTCSERFCRQSPIDLKSSGLKIPYSIGGINTNDLLDISYIGKTLALQLKGNGTGSGNYVSYTMKEGELLPTPASLRFNGRDFSLTNVHFHAPSEHTLNGKRFPVEVHFVHKANSSSEFLVMGIFLEGGSWSGFDKLLEPVYNTLLLLSSSRAMQADSDSEMGEEEESQQDVDISALLGDSSQSFPLDSIDSVISDGEDAGFVFEEDYLGTDVFYYPGSLTTPPYSSDVTWLVQERPVPVAGLSRLPGYAPIAGLSSARPVQESVSNAEVLQFSLVKIETSEL
jgi:carbonic anhydrase